MKTATQIEALIAAKSALEAWGNYGKEMKKHGLGCDCSQSSTGYTNDYLIALIVATLESHLKPIDKNELMIAHLKAQRDDANLRATNALIERDMLRDVVKRLMSPKQLN